jgi:hypothetical protein
MVIEPRDDPTSKNAQQGRQQHQPKVVVMMNTMGDPEHFYPN